MKHLLFPFITLCLMLVLHVAPQQVHAASVAQIPAPDTGPFYFCDGVVTSIPCDKTASDVVKTVPTCTAGTVFWSDDTRVTVQTGSSQLLTCRGKISQSGQLGQTRTVTAIESGKKSSAISTNGYGKATYTCTMVNGSAVWRTSVGNKTCSLGTTPTEPAMCSTPVPPTGCTYVPGANYNPKTGCGMELSCSDTPSYDGGPTPVDTTITGPVCGYLPSPICTKSAPCSYAPTVLTIYPNMSALNAAGAIFYSKGACTGTTLPGATTNTKGSGSAGIAVGEQNPSQMCTTIKTTLALGDGPETGKELHVTSLQKQLVNLGYLTMPASAAYGYYGPLTAAAVKAFQATYGLPQTGVVDNATLTKLNTLCTAGVTSGTTTCPAGQILVGTKCLTTPPGGPTLSTVTVNFMHDGIDRLYNVHLPKGYNASKSYPVLFVAHGGGGTAEFIEKTTEFSTHADTYGYIAVYGQGAALSETPTWNAGDCCGLARDKFKGTDDVGYVREVIAQVSKAYSVDSKRIYAAGLSNGGMLANRLGCEAADLFAGIATVAGTIQVSTCKPSKQIPVFIMHGTADPKILYNGGKSTTVNATFLPVETAFADWGKREQCSGTIATTAIPPLANDGKTVDKLTFPKCGKQVVLYRVNGGMHEWPTGGPEATKVIDASKTILEFFGLKSSTTNTPTTQEPVCGQPPMPICPKGMQCVQVMPPATTYSSMSALTAAGATYLYTGSCKSTTLPPATTHSGIMIGEPNPAGYTLDSGTYERSVYSVDRTRPYLLHVPKSYNPKNAAELVLFYHGGGGDMKQAARAYEWKEESEKRGFIVAFTNGTSNLKSQVFASWNAGTCCDYARDNNTDDITYTKLVIDDIKKEFNITQGAVFASGFSNGSMMVHRLACEAPELFRAVGGSSGTDGTYVCPHPVDIPFMYIHAIDDTHVLFNGGAGEDAFPDLSKVTEFLSVPDTTKNWVDRYKLSSKPKRVLEKTGVYCDLYSSTKSTGKFKLCVTADGKHSWAGAPFDSHSGAEPSTAIQATAELWKFFEAAMK